MEKALAIGTQKYSVNWKIQTTFFHIPTHPILNIFFWNVMYRKQQHIFSRPYAKIQEILMRSIEGRFCLQWECKQKKQPEARECVHTIHKPKIIQCKQVPVIVLAVCVVVDPHYLKPSPSGLWSGQKEAICSIMHCKHWPAQAWWGAPWQVSSGQRRLLGITWEWSINS